jgi:type III pantothenate kinase
MNLVIDQGNTRSKIAVFKQDEIIFEHNYDVFEIQQLENISNKYPDISRSAISNVSDINEELGNALSSQYKHITLSHTTPLPIHIKYKTPETLGSDRLAVTVGGNNAFPNEDVLIIDAGTCITYDFVNKNCEYIGGSISPGLNMRFKALNTFTNNLPLLEQHEQQESIGDNTESSIIAGVQQGICHEMEGVICNYSSDYPNIKVIITGGDQSFFHKALKSDIFADSFLLLKGLNDIIKHNTELE